MKTSVPPSVRYTITIFYGKHEQKFEHCKALEDFEHMTWFIDKDGKRHAMRGYFHAVEE